MLNKVLVRCGICFLFVAASLPAHADVAHTPKCRLGAMSAAVSTTGTAAATGSVAKVVPETAVKFTSGTSSNCVLVQFSSETNTDGTLYLTATVDGIKPLPSGNNYAVAAVNTNNASTFNFVFENIPAGDHTAVVRALRTGGTFANIGWRSTVVQYAP